MSRLSPDNVILGLLATKPCHGYQLLEHFRAPGELGRIWHLSTSQLYSILKRLEKRGLVIGQKMESDDAPTRTEYQLSETGHERLHQWMHEKTPSASTRRIRTEFLSRLVIARLLNIPIPPIIQHQIATCQERQADILIMRDQVGDGIGFLSLDLLVSELTAILQWINRCHNMLTKPKDDATEGNGYLQNDRYADSGHGDGGE